MATHTHKKDAQENVAQYLIEKRKTDKRPRQQKAQHECMRVLYVCVCVHVCVNYSNVCLMLQ